MILPISLTTAAAAAILNFWLGIRIGQVRTREKISVGDGGNEALIRRMRAQANFVEFTPFVLILIALIELGVGTSTWLWAVSAVYIIGRIAHAIGMDGNSKARGIGISITLVVMLGLALYGAWIAHSSDGTISTPATEMLPAA
jgi:uncharacterized membrane protein YecN with MAPEG domain